MGLFLEALKFWAVADKTNGAAPLTGTGTFLTNEEANHYNLNYDNK